MTRTRRYVQLTLRHRARAQPARRRALKGSGTFVRRALWLHV